MGRGTGGGGGTREELRRHLAKELPVPQGWKRDTKWAPGAHWSIMRVRGEDEVSITVPLDNAYALRVDPHLEANIGGSRYFGTNQLDQAVAWGNVILDEGWAVAAEQMYGR